VSATKSDPSVELAALRKRVGRMEIGALVERGVILYLLYLSRDRIDELVMISGGLVLALLAAFAVIERVRSKS
jgi:hypothetical protein